MSDLTLLAKAAVWDPDASPNLTAKYWSNGPWVTGSADTPAHKHFEPLIASAGGVTRTLVDAGRTTGRTQVGYGELTLRNSAELDAEGALDGYVDLGWDARELVLYLAEAGDAFPGGVTTLMVATMLPPVVGHTDVRFRVRDRTAEVQVALQENLYAGDNVLPAGLEGTEELAGQPKPLLWGRVYQAEPVLVNSSRHIYQIHDGLLQEVENVFDRGVKLGRTFSAWADRDVGVTFDANDSISTPNAFTVVGDGGAIYRTTDAGQNWSAASSNPFGAEDVLCLAYNPDDDVLVAGTSGGNIGYSTDEGDTWTLVGSPPFGTDGVTGMAYGQNKFVAVSNGDDSSQGTANGQTWAAAVEIQNQGGVAWSIAFGRDRFVATYTNTWYSTDQGASWSQGASALSTVKACITHDGEQFYAGTDTTDNHIESSPDGISWVIRESTGTFRIKDLAFGGPFRALVAAGGETGQSDSAVLTSSDEGTTWIKRTTTMGSVLGQTVALSDDEALVFGNGGEAEAAAAAGSYASEADLLDDDLQPDAGTFKAYLSADGSYVRLGSKPRGRLTVNAKEGATAADRTAGQLFAAVFSKLGMASDYSAADVSDLDSQFDAEAGIYIRAGGQADESLDRIADTAGAWWGPDLTGTFRIKRILDPSTATSTRSLTKTDVTRGTLERPEMEDEGGGLPFWRTVVRYRPNYTPQSESDLAGSVEDATRAAFKQAWRAETDEDVSVRTKHPLAPEFTVNTLLWAQADASAEATRIQTLRGARRDRFAFEVPMTKANAGIDLGDVIDLTHPRMGLSGGKNLLVIGVEPLLDSKPMTIRLNVWG